MRLFFILIGIIAIMSACQSSQNQVPGSEKKAGIHEVVVQEVVQVSSYTYLRVKENGAEQWLAVPKMEASVGATYYFEGGMKMTNFNSKELSKTFETIYFLERISTDPSGTSKTQQTATNGASTNEKIANVPANGTTQGTKGKVEKLDIKVKPAEGGITIAQLLKDKKKYAGKTVKIRVQVTKFSAAIMNKNWIHLQDGTDHEGKFDLTATTKLDMNVGDNVIIEGKIILDKDFGYGYFYDILMEDAVIK